MKNLSFFCAALAAPLYVSCLAPVPAVKEPAVLRLTCDVAASKATSDPYDINNYELTLSKGGKTVWYGLWGERPAEFELDPGDYQIAMASGVFEVPAYECPVYGDSRSVSLAEGQVSEIELVASQRNAGLRLLLSESFVAVYKDGTVFLRSAEGTLAHGYSESRTAYFRPGAVSVLLNHNGKTVTVHTMELLAGEVLTLRLTVGEKMPSALLVSGVSVNVRVDTSRVWSESSYAWDGSASEGPGSTVTTPDAVSVSVARGMAGSKDVWVCGYVVGGDLSSASCSFEGPFSSRTNLLIADAASCRDRSLCMSVQLAAGDIRNALNLVDNPSMLGRKVWLRGDVVEAYYKIPGLQNLSDYRL